MILYGIRQTGSNKVFHIRYRVLASRKHNCIGFSELLRRIYIPDRYICRLPENVKIRKVCDIRMPDDRNVDLSGLSRGKSFRQGVFVVKIKIRKRHDPKDGTPGLFFKHTYARCKERCITAELVDDKARNSCPLVFGKKIERSDKLCEHASPVNVTDEEHL